MLNQLNNRAFSYLDNQQLKTKKDSYTFFCWHKWYFSITYLARTSFKMPVSHTMIKKGV